MHECCSQGCNPEEAGRRICLQEIQTLPFSPFKSSFCEVAPVATSCSHQHFLQPWRQELPLLAFNPSKLERLQ